MIKGWADRFVMQLPRKPTAYSETHKNGLSHFIKSMADEKSC